MRFTANKVHNLTPAPSQIASVMGMSVSVDLLQATYPIAATCEALERDLLELEKTNFLRPTDVPGTWLMTQAGTSPAPCLRKACQQ